MERSEETFYFDILLMCIAMAQLFRVHRVRAQIPRIVAPVYRIADLVNHDASFE